MRGQQSKKWPKYNKRQGPTFNKKQEYCRFSFRVLCCRRKTRERERESNSWPREMSDIARNCRRFEDIDKKMTVLTPATHVYIGLRQPFRSDDVTIGDDDEGNFQTPLN